VTSQSGDQSQTDPPRAYEGFTLADQPVALGDEGEQGVATITQDRTGALSVRVARDPRAVLAGFFRRNRPTIRTALGRLPSVLIERAAHHGGRSDGDGSYTDFWAAEVTIRHAEVQPTDEIRRKYFLTGFNFSDAQTTFVAGGITWTLQLLDTHLATGRVISDGRGAVTAVLTTEAVPASRSAECDQTASLIESLLSFASGGFVGAARIDEEREGATTATVLRPNEGPESLSLRPIPLESATPGVVNHFIESSYPAAQSVSAVLPLPRLIASTLRMRDEGVVHTKALLAANFLEIVRYHHALNVMVPAGRAEPKNEIFRHPGPGRPLTFDEIIGDFVRTHGLTRWDAKYTKFRNRIVHEGEIDGATLLDQHAAVMEVAHFCDTVVLALLNWDHAGGTYIPCNDWERSTPTTYGINVVPFSR
jgi:hypothetical protein